MIQFLQDLYSTAGVIFLVISATSWATSHILVIKGTGKLDFAAKITGFVSLILVFITAGWMAGLISLPIIFVASFLGAGLARGLRKE
ncbi:MAG: hypothetical protein A3E36_04725 [Candidatus Andersenbacteria bacterium RIFCSPHIGHO2_12_FULL_45_11b]|uniref:Uncharacterized protein n=1 Tax=Candidatus Andersenbacteria bacterium RIFCSPHIGHO2_12_FULL_45_11b TaxID=1797282 RepID=A0A1G1XC70_9BACT|nr:MAG: hypothetical protein A3E36_04725 [Candidatus Andersenbacteria bacterium RIFCSPHIGHO2_12_FULL_45_11b]